MIIGIDAFFLSMKDNTGIGNNVIDVMMSLSKIDFSNNYILFTPSVYHKDIAEQILKNKNFKIVTVKSVFYYRRLWLQSLRLRKAIIDNSVDIFWGGGEYVPVCLPKRIKTCATILDVVFKILPETIPLKNKMFYKLLFPFSVKKTDSFITVTNHSRNELIQYLSIEPERVTVISCGINLKRFVPSGRIAKKKIILFVGTLQPRKNLISLIEAFRLAEKEIEHDLVIVGAAGWKNSEISEKILSLPEKLKNRIIFKGFISDNDLVDLYQTAELFVAPSLHEGFGLIIAEAIACGTPVITSKRGAITEVFDGIPEYADPESPEDIAEKMISLLSDPLKMGKMIERGLEYIRRYDIDSVAKEYISYFNRL
jgi:glycosyltransferase involved in cell wall biosynthesis